MDAPDLHATVSYENMRQLVALAMEIKHQLNQRQWMHPESGKPCKVELVEILDEPAHPEARTRTLVVFGDGQVARDPCASGTCAALAVETARGNLQVGEEYVCEGIVGSIYRANVLRTCHVGSFQAVVPEIRGRTFITGSRNLCSARMIHFEDGFFDVDDARRALGRAFGLRAASDGIGRFTRNRAATGRRDLRRPEFGYAQRLVLGAHPGDP